MNQGDIQEIIDNVNNNHQSNYLQIEALQKINEAVEKCDAPKLRWFSATRFDYNGA